MGSYEEVSAEGGGWSAHLGKVLLRVGTSSVSIWGGDMGAVNSNVNKALGSAYGFPTAG